MVFTKLTFTRQQLKNMKEKCAEQPIPSGLPIQLANLLQLHPWAWWCSVPLLAGKALGVQCVCELVRVISDSQAADFSVKYSGSAAALRHVSLHRLNRISLIQQELQIHC